MVLGICAAWLYPTVCVLVCFFHADSLRVAVIATHIVSIFMRAVGLVLRSCCYSRGHGTVGAMASTAVDKVEQCRVRCGAVQCRKMPCHSRCPRCALTSSALGRSRSGPLRPPSPPSPVPPFPLSRPPSTEHPHGRVMEALADVSQQRRKLEATAASLMAKSAAASARLAQDSRAAAAALMGELRARREASTPRRHHPPARVQAGEEGVAKGGSIAGAGSGKRDALEGSPLATPDVLAGAGALASAGSAAAAATTTTTSATVTAAVAAADVAAPTRMTRRSGTRASLAMASGASSAEAPKRAASGLGAGARAATSRDPRIARAARRSSRGGSA